MVVFNFVSDLELNLSGLPNSVGQRRGPRCPLSFHLPSGVHLSQCTTL